MKFSTFLLALITLSFLFSCEHRISKKINLEEAVSVELNQISFQEVDMYPSFSSCKTNEDVQKTKDCFIETLHKQLTPFFENYILKNDSLSVVIEVSKTGEILVTEIKSSKNQELKNFKLELNSFLNQEELTVYPAYKQGIPVKCSLILPVIITNEI